MSRLASYVGIIVALAIWFIIVALSGNTTIQNSPVKVVSIASSTPLVDNSVAATSTKTAVAPKQVTTVTPASTPVPVTQTTVAPSVPLDNSYLDAAASSLRAALVNILCYAPVGSKIHSISGSGVFIDSKGIILTNAHIAQYFLLADRGVSCTIRSGSPAKDSYNASPIYISPSWLKTNSNVLSEDVPIGTGEYDFGLLAVSKSATTSSLPASFPYIPLAQIPPNTGASIVIASYGAQFLESNQIASNLFPTIVFGSVKDVFTFATNTIDVLALGGSAAAQEGSSGGGITDTSGTLVGTITTSTTEGSTNTRSLGAITASYIRAQFFNEVGQSIDILLSEPTTYSINDFASKIPMLESIVTAGLH